MNPSAFVTLAKEVHGRWGWQAIVAKHNNVNRSTVYRWGTGEIPLPVSAIDNLQRAAAHKAAALVTAALIR